ncbi:YIP1 family protein [Natronorubrum halophilum]|uniref:YIP1 family protein n=1 Tax=Natronorubrum halophilum TaxID=1702106 RepID=UPI0010C1CC2F|nr:YIP1 family protein [Natronorubrum halophilum]
MSDTPLVAPGEYFDRTDAFSLQRAVGLALAYWLGSVAVAILWRVTGDFDLAPVTVSFVLQTLEATLLYWVVPTVVLYGLGYAVGATGEPADTLALAAWGLVPLLAGQLISNVLLYALALLEADSTGSPAGTEIWLFVPLTLLACGWAAYIWRGGLQAGFDLDRSTATATALLAAAICAGLLLVPILPSVA